MAGGDACHARFFDYLTSKCPDLEILLKWAENFDTQIVTDAAVKGTVFMMEESANVLSGHVYGFLGACLEPLQMSILFELCASSLYTVLHVQKQPLQLQKHLLPHHLQNLLQLQR